jgi:hypothetical protein
MKKFLVAVVIGVVLGVAYSCVGVKEQKSIVLEALDAGQDTAVSSEPFPESTIQTDPKFASDAN